MAETTSTASTEDNHKHDHADKSHQHESHAADHLHDMEPVSSNTEANTLPVTSEGPEVDLEKSDSNEDEKSKAVDGSPGGGPAAFDPTQFPDGGLHAWLCVLGSFCCLFCSFGWINCIGIFQEYYESHFLQGYSSSTVSWITSLETFMMFAFGPIIGKWYDSYGPRWILLTGTFLHLFGLMMASLSSEYYQFILAQGIVSPIGASMIFYSANSSLTSWFLKKRAFAFGLSAAGSSIGGLVIPIMVSHLITEVGFPWAMRTTAFLLLFMLFIANFTVKSRLPPSPRPVKPYEFIQPFTELPFLFTSIGCLLFFFGMFLPINYLVVQAQAEGMSAGLSIYLISILNALSLFGRTLPGYVADKVGRFNVMIAMCLFTSIIDFAIWIPASSNAAFIVFSAVYGFGSGALVSLAPSLIAQISDVRKIGVRTGANFALISIAALTGSPIGGAILGDWNGDFLGMQLFTGIMQMSSVGFFIAARVTLVGLKVAVKV